MARKKPVVVAAVGTAGGTLNPSGKKLAKMIEAAMVEAIKECMAEGISLSDSETVRARIQAARQRVKESVWPSSTPSLTQE